MKIDFIGIVREIKTWDKDKDGNTLPAEKITDQITFLDRTTGGDIVITFPQGHGYITGADVNVKTEVKPVIRNFKLALYAVVNAVEAAPLPPKPEEKKK